MIESFYTAYKGYAEIIIEKSRFIGFVHHIASEQEAMDFLKDLSKAYHDSTHICYAYRFGQNAEFARYSDDGEPSGTAGLPIMNVLRGNNLNNVIIAIVRYFGGIKLGTGGLVRAYTDSTLAALDMACQAEVVSADIYNVRLSLSDYSKVLGVFSGSGIKVISSSFEVEAVVQIAVQHRVDIVSILTQKTAGRAKIEKIEQRLIEF